MNKKNLLEEIFTSELKAKTDPVVAKYETKRASMLEVLRIVMEHYGYVSLDMERAVAEYLEVPAINVREVVTFYTLYYTKPKAKTRFNVCRTLTCALQGGEEMVQYLEEKLGIKRGETTSDEKFSLCEVECLGACEIAPMMQLNDDEYIGNLTKEKINKLITE